MKDLIKGIEEIINKHQQKFLDDVGETLVDEERLATSIAESICVDEEKVGDIVENFCSGNEERPGESYEKWSERFVEALSKGDILKVVE